jgi:hypothetical protein
LLLPISEPEKVLFITKETEKRAKSSKNKGNKEKKSKCQKNANFLNVFFKLEVKGHEPSRAVKPSARASLAETHH